MATPIEFVVPLVGDTAPHPDVGAVGVKLTVAPATGPDAFDTVAVRTSVDFPSAATFPEAAVNEIEVVAV